MRLLAALLLAAPAPANASASGMTPDLPYLMALYRHLHASPELAFQERATAARLAAEARKLGFEVTTGAGRTGVVAVMRNGPGPVLLVRADMDALPIREETGLPFASKVTVDGPDGGKPGVMHACGHDIHMAAWVGTARRLIASRADWKGTLVMIAQPAEEIGEGAKAMLADGLYTRFPKPDVALAIHNSSDLPAGEISYVDGFATANVDSVEIRVKGVGGHGAAPQFARDPIVLAARIVTTLQTLVSRETDPLDAAVVTVGTINGGTAENIIPGEVRMQLTVRSHTPAVRKILLDGIARIARGEAIAAGMPDDRMPEVLPDPNPGIGIRNTQPLTDKVIAALKLRLGDARVHRFRPEMGGEDFSLYGAADPAIQSLFLSIGAVPRAQWDAAGGNLARIPGLHSARWAPDAEVGIATATEALTTAALLVLAKR